MKKICLTAIAVSTSLLAGCSSINNAATEKQKSVELYRVFDITTQADRDTVAEAASFGLGMNVSSANEHRPIVMGEKPPKPGRFKPVDGSKQFGQAGGMVALAMRMNNSLTNMLKTAECDGAVWTATAQRDVENAFSMSFNLCLWEYQNGFALDVYANYTKSEGGGFLGIDELARQTAYAISGTPEEWAEKTVLDVVRTIKTRSSAEVRYLEGYPKINTTPWQDSGDVINEDGILAPVTIAPN